MSVDPQLKILVAEDEPDLREILCLLVSSELSAQIIEASSGNQAIQLLKENPDIKMIISDFNMPNGTGGDLHRFLKGLDLITPFILVTSDSLSDHPDIKIDAFTGYISKPFTDSSFYKEVHRLIDQAQLPIPAGPEYVPIALLTLLKIGMITCPLFIKLSETKFIKIISENSVFDQATCDHIAAKGSRHLYVPKEDLNGLIEKFKTKVFNDMLFTSLVGKSSEAIKISNSAQDLVLSTIKNFGLNEEVISLAKKNIQLIGAIMESTPELDDLMKLLTSDDSEEGISHSVVLCYLTTAISRAMPIAVPHSEEILAMASFFHDAILTSNQVRNEARFVQGLLMKSSLNKSDLNQVATHMEKVVDFLSGWKTAPPELSTVIAQHHERPDGTGFPQRLNGDQIHEISACFAVAHELVDITHDFKSKATIREEFLKRKLWFSHPKFKRFAEAALAMLK